MITNTPNNIQPVSEPSVKNRVPMKAGTVVRWIVSDLDGTLLDSRQQVPDAVAQRVGRFSRGGGSFMLATGRTLTGTMPFIRQLGIQSPVILCNGAQIYDPASGVYLYERFLPEVLSEQALALFEVYGPLLDLDLLVFHRETIYSTRMSKAVRRQMLKDGIEITEQTLGKIKEKLAAMNKMMLIGLPASILRFQELALGLNTVRSEPELLEILPPGANKGEALRTLMETAGCRAEQVAVVGDNLNDLEMIYAAEHSFAVSNSHHLLKEAALHITKGSNNERAVCEVIDYAEATWTAGLDGQSIDTKEE